MTSETKMNSEANGYLVYQPTLMERLMRWAYPAKAFPIDGDDDDNAEGDAIYIDHAIRLSWPDRVKTFLSGKIMVKTVISTEHKPGKLKTVSVSYPTLRIIEGESE